MDFSRECLDKSTEFGVLWYYGNKDGKIVPKDVEKYNLKLLFKFIQIHKDVVDYEHWTILFKGFFVIMLNRLELIHREFKTLGTNLKKKDKPTISEFQLILNKKVDIEIDLLSIDQPAPVTKKAAKKVVEKKKKDTLIKEAPAIYLGDPELEAANTVEQLQDDGFGGQLVSNGPINVDEFFDVTTASQQQQRPTTPERQYADDLPDLNLSPIGHVSQSAFGQIDDTIEPLDQDDTLVNPLDSQLKSREQFAESERPSALPSSLMRSADLSIGEFDFQQPSSQPLSQAPSLAQSRAASQHESQQGSQQRSELSFNLSEIDEQQQQPQQSRKRRRAQVGLIIDEVNQLPNNFFNINQEYHNKHVSINFVKPTTLPVDRLFTRPLISNSINPVDEELNFYSTEPCDTDQLVFREFPDDEDEEDRLSERSAAFSQHGDDRLEDDAIIEQVTRDLLFSMVDQVSIQIDRQDEQPMDWLPDDDWQPDYPAHFDSHLDSHTEMARDASSRQIGRSYLSSFEPVMMQSNYETTRTTAIRDRDLDSLRSFRGEDEFASQNISVLSELSESYVNKILDVLESNDGEITFSALTEGFRRSEAAKCFADLLAMKMRREVELIQHDTTHFDEIYIKKI